MRVLALLALLASATPATAGVSIEHEPIECVVAGRFTRVGARIGGDGVTRARVYFRADSSAPWYYTELLPEAGTYIGRLPRVKRGVARIEYYVDAVDLHLADIRSVAYK